MKTPSEETQFISQLWHSGDLANAELAQILAAQCEEPTAFVEDALAVAMFSKECAPAALEYLHTWAAWSNVLEPFFITNESNVRYKSVSDLLDAMQQRTGDRICRKSLILAVLRATQGRHGIELAFDEDGTTWIPESILLPALQTNCVSDGFLSVKVAAKRMPILFCKLQNVRSLSLLHAPKIETLPPQICELQGLETLCASLHLKTLPPEIQDIKTLKNCFLQISDKGDDIQNLRYLKHISNVTLSNTDDNISRLPATLCELATPTFCSITSRKSVKNWQVITHWTTLPALVLYFYEPHPLPKELAVFNELIHIDFYNVHFKRMPLWFGKLKELHTLRVHNNKPMSVFPPSVFKLHQLSQLSIRSSTISSLPDLWHRLPNIEYLTLSNNLLSQLPPSFAKLRNLKYLALDNNNFKKVPPVLRNLHTGIVLNLSNNFLTEWLPLLDLTNFRQINLYNAFINDETLEEFKKYIAKHLTKRQQERFIFVPPL